MSRGAVFNAYEKGIRGTRLLTPEREAELAELIQAGRAAAGRVDSRGRRTIAAGKRAEAEYIEGNLRLVLAVVGRMKRPLPMDRDDLIQEGNLGLMHALEKFDWSRGVKFSAYAYTWIRQYITRAISNQSRLIRIPVYVDDDILRVRRARDRLAVELGRTATDDEVAEALGMTVRDVLQLELYNVPPVSLSVEDGEIDIPVRDEEDEPEPASNPVVASMLDSVTKKQRRVLELLYGLGDEGSARMTKPEVAKHLGRSECTVASMERRALDTLRAAA